MTPRWWAAPLVLITLALAACGGSSEVPAAAPAAAESPAAATAPAPAVPAARKVVFLGDSLTAGLGLPIEQAYPSLIEARLRARDRGWAVVNAGVSGDTSAGGLRRLEWSMDGGAAIVVVALGGNDGLRGLPVDDLSRNLDAIVGQAKAAGADVVVAGMEAPPNTGPDYTRRFRAVYGEVAARHGATLLPFLLDGVAGELALNQADGIHPNQEGARRVADHVWRVLEPLVEARERAATE